MRQASLWTILSLAMALGACSSSSAPPCGAQGQPCCDSVVCGTGLACLADVCTLPGGGGGGPGGSSTTQPSGSSSSGGTSSRSSSGGTSSSHPSSSSSGAPLPGDTCGSCDVNPCTGATDDCVCDPTDSACSNGYCAADCYDSTTGAGNPSLCQGGTHCLEVVDATGSSGDDGNDNDYVCYPADGTCVGVTTSSSSSSSGSPSTTTQGGSSSSGASSTVAACGGVGQSCCDGTACNGSLVCQGGSCAQPQAGVAGTPCQKNSDCSTGICLPVGQPANGQPAGEPAWTGNVCTTSCTGATDCVSGWSCAALIGQSGDVCQCKYAPEVCDGLDNDCNGIVDDEPQVDQACERQDPMDVCQGGSCTCAAQFSNCGLCTNLSTDPQNCGSCGNACQSPLSACDQGTCACPTGETFCGASCINTATDPANCGGCGVGCADGGVCKSGSCGCPTGETACSGSCLNTSSNNDNCGTCGTVCESPATCVGGSCSCPADQPTSCSGTCTNLQQDDYNCGSCGNDCTQLNCGSGTGDPIGACVCGSCLCCNSQGPSCLTNTCN